MRGAMLIGLIGGVIFGIVLVWHGAGAAGLVLLFSVVGWFLGVVAWLGWRIATGDIDPQELRRILFRERE